MATRHFKPARERMLDHWNREAGAAIAHRDRPALKALQATIEATTEALDGTDKAKARALLARVQAGIRYARAGLLRRAPR